RRPHSERARLVGGGQHDATAADGAHNHRFPGEFGLVTDLHAGEEGIHVHVQDVAARIVRVLAPGRCHRDVTAHRYPSTWNWAAKSWKAGCAATARCSRCRACPERGAAAATTGGTGSANPGRPSAAPGRSPARSIGRVTPARVNRRGPVPAGPRPAGAAALPSPLPPA